MRRPPPIVLLGLALLLALGGVVLYVTLTPPEKPDAELAPASGRAFAPDETIAPGAFRGAFSPDGTRVAALTASGLGVVERGVVRRITPDGAAVVDFAWMPGSGALLVAEGPLATGQVSVVDVDGTVTGVARLDPSFSFGGGHGLTVDSRGARAVAVATERDPIGGEERLDLMLIDLPTGKVTPLTRTPDVDERLPAFVDDEHVLLSNSRTGRPSTVELLDLASGGRRVVSQVGEEARAVGVIEAGRYAVYTALPSRDSGIRSFTVWAVPPLGGARHRLGTIPRGAILWSVEPTGVRGLISVTEQGLSPDEPNVTRLRAVEFDPPPR